MHPPHWLCRHPSLAHGNSVSDSSLLSLYLPVYRGQPQDKMIKIWRRQPPSPIDRQAFTHDNKTAAASRLLDEQLSKLAAQRLDAIQHSHRLAA